MKDALIVIPAFNEEQNIGMVLDDIAGVNVDADVLVVNDGSTDRTRDIVYEKKFKIVSHPYNRGYGAALQTGFRYAVSKGYKYVIQFDADGQHDTLDITSILKKLRKDETDIVIGSRFLENASYRTSLAKKAAIGFFKIIIKLFTGMRITDPTSGLQGLSSRTFEYYSSSASDFPCDYPDADILIRMIRLKYVVAETPANIRPRLYGKSMHGNLKPVYYLFKVMFSILAVLIREKIQVKESLRQTEAL